MDRHLLSGRRVLIVEDEMLVLMAIEDLLVDLGCTSISVAASVDAALALISSGEFDLATLDVNLNGQRSDTVATALIERGVPFAFSTGYGSSGENPVRGTSPVLAKPYTTKVFTDMMRELIASGPALRAVST
jgi:CheY-like chemotaxis protein